jgi:hypothetical protein
MLHLSAPDSREEMKHSIFFHARGAERRSIPSFSTHAAPKDEAFHLFSRGWRRKMKHSIFFHAVGAGR